MSNFSQTHTRLDNSVPFGRLLSIVLIYWGIILITHVAILLVPVQKASESQPSSPASTSLSSDPVSIYDILRMPLSNMETPWPKTSIDLSEQTNTLAPLEKTVPTEDVESTKNISPSLPSSLPSCLYLHVKDNTDSRFYWVPEFLEERISENDIFVDLSTALDPDFAYELSDYFKQLVCLAVECEASDEPFLGKVLVAEGIISRIRIGIYGPNIKAILVRGYQADMDEDGNLHFYQGPKEILEASESAKEAVDLALSGSRFSYLLLQATTEFRNEQYGLQLDETYYQWGSIYHFSHEDISGSRIAERSLNQVPVSFHYGRHILYGYWLNKSEQLDL